jgi:hypothetical protein
MGWRIIATGYTCYGLWLTFYEEAMVQSTVADMNRRYVGEKTHWIEYEQNQSPTGEVTTTTHRVRLFTYEVSAGLSYGTMLLLLFTLLRNYSHCC